MGCALCSNNLNTNFNTISNINSTDIKFNSITESSAFSSNDKSSQRNQKVISLTSSTNNNRSLFIVNKKQKTHNKDKDSNKTLPSISTTYHSVYSLITPSSSMLKLINTARTNPLCFVDKIEQLKQKIYLNNSTHNYYLQIDNQRIILHKGIESFDNCISYLKTLAKQPPLKPLIMKDELKLPFPSHSTSLCIEANFLKNLIMFKTTEIESQFTILDFHYDVCVCDSEISTLLQIVDDTNDNYQRRKNIFNKQAHFVGISDGKLNDSNLCCYYLLFAK